MIIKCWSEVDASAPRYFKKIIDLCKESYPGNESIQILLVDHCLQTFESHVQSLQRLGSLAGVILKSSTRVPEAETYAKEHYNIISVSKEELMDPELVISMILNHTVRDKKIVIMDHGGYFCLSIEALRNHSIISKQLMGVVEVTENGHRKWEIALQKTDIPCLSIARSEAKALEDLQVGVSICDVTNNLLYGIHEALTSLEHACILGYGKIGSSIANHLRKIGIARTTVIEVDLLRAQMARKHGHTVIMSDEIQAKIQVYQSAQIIFSATGSKALSEKDLSHLRNIRSSNKRVMYIATCTSPDDEFDSNFIPALEKFSSNTPLERKTCEKKFKLTPYNLLDGREIIILNGGKAVNFAMGGTPGYEICQVWAANLLALSKIVSSRIGSSNAVQVLTHQDELAIAKVTEEVFFTKEPSSKAQPQKPLVRSSSMSDLIKQGLTLFAQSDGSSRSNQLKKIAHH